MLPKYVITVDDEFCEDGNCGWTKTAFTNRPAIRIKGMAFSADIKHEEMFFTDKLKYRIAAPAMIPSTIYRNQDGEEFYVEFTEKEIEKIHSKFMKNFGKNKDFFNLEHDSEQMVPAYMLECWLVENPEKDKSFSTYGIKVPKGSLFIVAQITDKEYYHQLVENGQTGFSIEGFLGLSLSMSEETSNEDINNNNNKETKMEKEMILPEGTKFQVEDKWYIVENGAIVEYKEEKTEEVEMAEEKVEETEEVEEVTEEVVTEEAPVETYTKAEVDAKFEELYKMIADMQAEKVEEVEEEKTEEVMMSTHQRFAEFLRFAKK